MTAHGDSSVPLSTRAPAGRAAGTATVTTALILTLAMQSAVPPFATDMYTPAFPRVTADLATSASLVGLTLTTFFLGMALGQLLGGPLSDQRGRRRPMIVGGLICTLGAVGCALAQSIGLLIVFRVVQGFGGGLAAVVARAVVVDVAKGDLLAKVMSIMMALGGLAPMVAPVLGGTVLTLGGTWRTVFWFLVGFGLLMMITAILFVPESLPPERRHGGGLRQFASGLSQVLRIRLYVGYMLTAALSGFTMMAYIANSSYVLQVQKGLRPLPFALFFASTALAQILLSVLNAKIVGRRFQPRTLIGFGLTLAILAVAALTVGGIRPRHPAAAHLRRVPHPDGGSGVHLRKRQCTRRRRGPAHRWCRLRRPRRHPSSGDGHLRPSRQLRRRRHCRTHDLGHDRRHRRHRRFALRLPRPCPAIG
jgi:DHA1 family bicyclomycin/chloramphenicol resistance-like MFS transporter